MKIEIENHYGSDVYTNIDTDRIRRAECMCLHCKKMTYDRKTNCPIAQKMYGIACEYDCAMMMTRCKWFVEKS